MTVENGKFLIWRSGVDPIVVDDYIKDFAYIEYARECYEELFDGTWIYNKIIIRKNKEINLVDYSDRNLVVNLVDSLVSEYM